MALSMVGYVNCGSICGDVFIRLVSVEVIVIADLLRVIAVGLVNTYHWVVFNHFGS